jgi:hypothetical protein
LGRIYYNKLRKERVSLRDMEIAATFLFLDVVLFVFNQSIAKKGDEAHHPQGMRRGMICVIEA